MKLAQFRRKRVLVIDDNVDQALSMALVFDVLGHEVQTAFDGREALEKARVFRPEVVVCDLGLPVVDGFAVARALRRDGELRTARLIAVSGYDVPDDSIAAGFDLHMTKPADVGQLAALVGGDAVWGSRISDWRAARCRRPGSGSPGSAS